MDIARTDLDIDASTPQGIQDTIPCCCARITEQDTIIAGLSAAAQNIQQKLDAANERREQSVSQHRADIAGIGECLLEEAQERQCTASTTPSLTS